MAGSLASGSVSPSARPSTSSKSTRRASDTVSGGGEGVKESKNWAEGDFAYEYVQITQVSTFLSGLDAHLSSLTLVLTLGFADRRSVAKEERICECLI